MRFRCTHSFVLCQPLQKKAKGGIIMPETTFEQAQEGDDVTYLEVLAVGPGMVQDGELIAPCCKVGDIVVADLRSSRNFKHPEMGHVSLMMDISIMAVVEAFPRSEFQIWSPKKTVAGPTGLVN